MDGVADMRVAQYKTSVKKSSGKIKNFGQRSVKYNNFFGSLRLRVLPISGVNRTEMVSEEPHRHEPKFSTAFSINPRNPYKFLET